MRQSPRSAPRVRAELERTILVVTHSIDESFYLAARVVVMTYDLVDGTQSNRYRGCPRLGQRWFVDEQGLREPVFEDDVVTAHIDREERDAAQPLRAVAILVE